MLANMTDADNRAAIEAIPREVVPTSVMVWDVSKWGMARWGGSDDDEAIRSESGNHVPRDWAGQDSNLRLTDYESAALTS
jgi:hypothetical protein